MTAIAETATPAAQLEPYQAALAMTPGQAKALDEQVRRCTEAVLRENTDYGHIPGTNGEEKSLWRPGAQKLLQWFRLECVCDRVEVERDDDGRKHGITYRAEVGRGLKTAAPVILATCEGTADYDETKFYQSEEQVKARLRDNEHRWAARDRRAPNADRWNNAKEYRADWNALMKRAQKRAIVGAVVDATAAGGIFSDREEDDTAAPGPEDGGPSPYEQMLEAALSFADPDDGNPLYVGAVHAARDGLISHRQKDHIQNRVRQRQERLKAGKPVDVEDLGRTPRTPAADDPDEAGPDAPGSATTPQIGAIWTVLTTVFKFGKHEKDQARAVCSHVIGHGLASTKDMSRNEAKTVLDTLSGWRETAEAHDQQPREFLIELMATAENDGDGDA